MEPEGSTPHSHKPATKESVWFLCFFENFVTLLIFYGEKLSAPRLTPKLEGHPLSAVFNCLFNIFAATLHIWRPFLQPQPEDAPCRGDRDPLITVQLYPSIRKWEAADVGYCPSLGSKYWVRIQDLYLLNKLHITPEFGILSLVVNLFRDRIQPVRQRIKCISSTWGS
jgi:hypothetical protein